MTNWRVLVALPMTLAIPLALAAPPRSKSLAQFDSGYTQCEKRDAAMRGHGDEGRDVGAAVQVGDGANNDLRLERQARRRRHRQCCTGSRQDGTSARNHSAS